MATSLRHLETCPYSWPTQLQPSKTAGTSPCCRAPPTGAAPARPKQVLLTLPHAACESTVIQLSLQCVLPTDAASARRYDESPAPSLKTARLTSTRLPPHPRRPLLLLQSCPHDASQHMQRAVYEGCLPQVDPLGPCLELPLAAGQVAQVQAGAPDRPARASCGATLHLQAQMGPCRGEAAPSHT